MGVDCDVDSFSPKLDGCLGVNHHSSSLPGDGTDHSLSDPVLMVRVRRAWFICCAVGSEHQAEGLAIELSSAIIASESLIWQHPYECEARIVVNE